VRTFRNSFFQSFLGSQLRIIIFIIILILISSLLIFTQKDESKTFKTIKSSSIKVVYIISSIVTTPFELLSNGLSKINAIKNLYNDAEKYKKERLIESGSFQELVSLKLKIAEYERLLNLNKDLEYSFITSRVLADLSKKYFSSILVNVGRRDGVFENMPITGPNGLLGKITDIDNSISRAMLATDVSSRIPVSVSDKSFQGILIGQNQKNPRIDFIKESSQVVIGDLVTTSGKGGIFPPYIFVGQVVKKGEDYLEVELFEDIDTLTHVRLINFSNNISDDF
tara:strand:+ start:2078 stop:2923 length:846 start_codon:yes stop_codon:yes gene_type:complete